MTDKIARYRLDGADCGTQPDDNGYWVRYHDYLDVVVQKDIDKKREGGVWRPISTAPTDGYPILLSHINDKGQSLWSAQAEWSGSLSWMGWCANLPILVDNSGIGRSPCAILGDIISKESYPPTHWMPLPEPPTS